MGMVFAAIMPILVVLPGAYLVFNNDASLNSIPIVGTTLLLAGGHGYFNPWTLRCPPICRYLDPAGAFRIIGAGCGNRAEYRSDWAEYFFAPYYCRFGVSTSPPEAEHLALYFILALTCLSLCFALYKPLLAVVHANLGSVYQAKGELAPNLTDDERQLYLRLARAHYDKAISCAPGNHTARQRLGRLAVDNRAGVERVGWWQSTQGEDKLAINAYRMSLRLEPGQSAVRELLGSMQMTQLGGGGRTK